MSYEKQQCDNNYLLLKPDEANFSDFFRFLFSPEYSETCSFIECPLEKQKLKGDFWRRWYIFISLFSQKLLLKVETPMVQIGKGLELCLNLPSSNGGLLKLLTKVLTGNLVRWPDRSSATFISVLGNLDQRVELDKSIRYDDPIKYNALLSIMASKLSYENDAFIQTVINNHWNMKYLDFNNYFWNDYLRRPATRAIMFQDTKDDPNLIVVAFRGTHPFDPVALRTDVDLSWSELEGVGMVHGGFMKALGRQKDKGWPNEIEQGNNQKQFAYYEIRQRLRDLLKKNKKAKFILTGHSLGAALAVLFLTMLAKHDEKWLMEKLEGVYTFGQPRVGDKKMGNYMKEKLEKYKVRYLRFVYSNDIVPRVPYDDETRFFTHFGRCLYYNSFYKGKLLPEEPNKNYFSVLWAIFIYPNAVWELIRSFFIIPYTRGPEYKEGWLMTMVRMIGLVIPGLADHCPQDYVNATRLGSLPPCLHQ